MTSNTETSIAGRVLALAMHGREDEPMVPLTEAHVNVDAGLEGDRSGRGDRGVTLLSREQWEDVRAELGADLPWHARRANVLVEGICLAETIGRTVRLGGVELHIHDETRPCAIMDKQHAGLTRTLAVDCRGGVHGQVIAGGMLRVGDRVVIEPRTD